MPDAVAAVPGAPFRELRSLWFQITGTLCNLACRHCFNSSGVGEFYFTGGEPFLHPDLFRMIEETLAVAPVTILTNGTLIDAALATQLTRIAVRLLADRGLYPIVTATEILDGSRGGSLYERLRARLIAAGIERPRIKILPVLPMGRCTGHDAQRSLTAQDLNAFDFTRLLCTETRVVAEGGIYACPILAGLGGARLGTDRLADALTPAALYHTACSTCYQTGLSCKNF